jgi:hypothetical protein
MNLMMVMALSSMSYLLILEKRLPSLRYGGMAVGTNVERHRSAAQVAVSTHLNVHFCDFLCASTSSVFVFTRRFFTFTFFCTFFDMNFFVCESNVLSTQLFFVMLENNKGREFVRDISTNLELFQKSGATT